MLIDSELMSELNKCLELARAEFDEEDEASDFDNYYIEIFKKKKKRKKTGGKKRDPKLSPQKIWGRDFRNVLYQQLSLVQGTCWNRKKGNRTERARQSQLEEGFVC